MAQTREEMRTPHPRKWYNGKDWFIERREADDTWVAVRVVFSDRQSNAEHIAHGYATENRSSPYRMTDGSGRVVWDSETWFKTPSQLSTLPDPRALRQSFYNKS